MPDGKLDRAIDMPVEEEHDRSVCEQRARVPVESLRGDPGHHLARPR